MKPTKTTRENQIKSVIMLVCNNGNGNGNEFTVHFLLAYSNAFYKQGIYG